MPLRVNMTLTQCEGQCVRIIVRMCETVRLKACVTRIIEGVMAFLCMTVWLRVTVSSAEDITM